MSSAVHPLLPGPPDWHTPPCSWPFRILCRITDMVLKVLGNFLRHLQPLVLPCPALPHDGTWVRSEDRALCSVSSLHPNQGLSEIGERPPDS